MPELPDVVVYIDRLLPRVVDQELGAVRLKSPFLLRSVTPPISDAEGKRVVAVRRMGKRIVLELSDSLFLVIHLMIAGRLRWREAGVTLPGKMGLAVFDFPTGSLLLTEAGSKKRASLYLVQGEDALAALDPGGLEVLDADRESFATALKRENRTLKRALTDPRLFSGIGNSYSDEILHSAGLSPVVRTSSLDENSVTRLFDATQTTLREWIERLRAESGDRFPEKVTAFRDEMAVHGRYKLPCPRCDSPVQRIVYASRECNYCATCQTGGKILKDRALSRLLREDWPRTLEELEEHVAKRGTKGTTQPPT